jgi:dUTP pyrophosphatase
MKARVMTRLRKKAKTNKDKEVFKVMKGDKIFIDFGVSIKLPKGYRADLIARSSTFKNTGMIQGNCDGKIDNSYCGNNDRWMAMFYCTENNIIERYSRLFQFELQKVQPKLKFIYVTELKNKDRGGYGSTGK